MIARLSLSRRVVLIAALALLALWLGAISAFYLNRGVEQTAGLPPPASIAALAELLDHASPEDRALILAAAERPGLTIRIEATPAEAAALPALLGPEATVLEGYREALAGRELAVIPRRRRIDWAMASALTDVEFRVGLAGSGTLVVTSESPIFVTPFGMPVGFGAGVIGLLVALAALILLNREFRPLSRLAEAVDQADPSLPLPPIRARSPELKALIAAFERLQARLAVLIRARMALVGGIQHDLRTFATRLRLRTDQIADPVERDRAATDIGHMIALLDDALLASRAGASELDEELVDLAALVAAEVADRRTAGAPVDLAPGPEGGEATVLGDRLALRRIVANLVDNALKYGRAAHLALGPAPNGEDIVFTVDDEGHGIPPDRRALLLEPFTRLEDSRARQTGGAGLGLAVVKSLAEAHHGSVEIGDAPGGGARLTVRLPLFRT